MGPGDRLYVTQSDQYQLAALRPSGDFDWALRVAWSLTPFPQDAIDSQVGTIKERFPEVTAGMFTWPEWLPALSRLVVDGHGHLYVFPYVRGSFIEEHGHRPVDVYSANGDHLFSGFINTWWQAAEGEFVYVYEEHDATGEWSVVRYRLVEPFD